ncbi:MAG: hypothetical protein WBN92_04495 [Terriglobia bacterium]
MPGTNLANYNAIPAILRSLVIILLFTTPVFGAKSPSNPLKKTGTKSFLAYVFDDRFSVVRAQPDVEAPFLRRLRVGHRVFLVAGASRSQESKFRRVVVSRNLSGWMLAAAVAAPGLAGDDERLFRYAHSQSREKALMALRILLTHFDRTPMRPAALLRLGQLAEEEAGQLSVRANRTLTREESTLPDNLEERDLFANFRGLDHLASNGIRFVYQRETDRFVYKGDAYREIVKRFSSSTEAASARERLAEIEEALK